MAEGDEFRVDRLCDTKSIPHFSRPEVSGYFSVNEDREFLPDASQLKYLNAPALNAPVKFNLNQAYHLVQRKPAKADDEKLDHLLQWILLNYPTIRASPESNRWIEPHFVCFRGLLTRLWLTPYEEQEGWIICACKWRGTIYLCAFDSNEKIREKANVSEKQLKFMSWGFKFEQFLLADSPGRNSDTAQGVNEAQEFCCLFTSQLGDNKLLYGAEMDGISSTEVLKEPIDFTGVNFVELKTSRNIETRRQDENFRKYKLIKWWCQSFLVGIDKVLCGFRDDNGIVRNLKSFDVQEMTRMSKGIWNGSKCMNFGNEFLDFVKSTVKKDYNECIYKFSWEPRIARKIKVQEVDPESDYAFIPKWFTDRATLH